MGRQAWLPLVIVVSLVAGGLVGARASNASASLGWKDAERALSIINSKPTLRPRLLFLARNRPVRCGIGVSADWPDHVMVFIVSAAGPWSQYYVGPEGENAGMRRQGPDYSSALPNGESLTRYLRLTTPCTLSSTGKVAINPAVIARASKRAAESDLRAATPSAEAYYEETNTYAGMSAAALRSIDSGLSRAVKVASASKNKYCLTATVENQTWSVAGPGATGRYRWYRDATCAPPAVSP